MATTTFVNYYEILEVPQTADAAQIKAAVSKQRRTWIKRQGSADASRRTEAEGRVRNIDEAERILLTPARRQAFDDQLAAHIRSGARDDVIDQSSDWLDRARAYLGMGNANAANRAAREATTRKGNDHEAWSIRAHSSFLMGQPADAEFEFAEAIRLAPDEPDYHQDLGEVFGVQEKWTQAMREFETALRLSPGNPVARTSIAQVLASTGKRVSALKIMEGVVAENPDNNFFKYYLAVTLDGAARESLTLLTDDAVIVTSAAQANLLDNYAKRMEALQLDDEEVAESIIDLRRMASSGRKMMWIHGGAWQVYAFALAVLLCGFCGGLGSGDGGGIASAVFVTGPLAALLIFVYVKRHRRHSYEHAAKQLGGLIVRRGI